MFTEDPNLTILDEKVFIYRNFIDPETTTHITEIADAIMSEDTSTEHRNPWYMEKFTPEMPELFPVWKKISEFLYPSHVIHPLLSLTTMRKGDDMFVHEDSPGEGHEDMLTVNDLWSSCCLLEYGVIAYFGKWEGGNVFYPELGIEVDPRPGDLVIHGATSRWKHGVREVTDGVRYAYSNFSLQPDKNPGSFYNYKTTEFLNQISTDGLDAWVTPLFENKREYRPFEG